MTTWQAYQISAFIFWIATTILRLSWILAGRNCHSDTYINAVGIAMPTYFLKGCNTIREHTFTRWTSMPTDRLRPSENNQSPQNVTLNLVSGSLHGKV